MAIYLNEDQFGADNAVIGFPHLLICMGIVLLTRGNMYGVHIVQDSHDNQTVPQFAAFLNRMGVIPADMVGLYGSCNFNIRYDGGGTQAWRTEMRHIAGLIGFAGTVRGFDTAIIAPRDGTYVEYLPNQAHDRCRVFYKRNEKMNYTGQPPHGGVVPGVFTAHDRNGGGFAPTMWAFGTIDANIIVTNRNRGDLHEVNYFLRMKSFNI